MMSYDFSGQCALVTGAGKGIGRETAKALARNGAEVIAVSRTQEDLDSLKQEIPGVVTVCVDVSDIAATKAAVGESELRRVNLLVNNAGVAELQSFIDVTEEAYDRVMDTNVKAVLFLSQIVAKGMIARGKGGAIVNVSSVASLVALNQHTSYSSSKAALDMLTKTMGLELGKHKIRVNSVNPTVVMTAMGKENWSDAAKAEPVLKRIPAGRFIEVDEVVNTILFLLSNSASGISCSIIPVDAGYNCCS